MTTVIYEKPVINLTLRCVVSLVIVAGCFFILGLRLWYLQILRGDFFRDQSENNRIRTVFVPPPRGMIYDRHGKLIARNRPSFNIELVPEDSPNPRESLVALARLLETDPGAYLGRLSDQKKRRRYEPRLIVKDVTRDMVAKVAAHSYELPGIVVGVTPSREYIYGSLGAHVLGYIREITREQLDSLSFQGYGYRQGDMVGQYGIEGRWELDLQGKRGVQAVVVNAAGIRIEESSFEPEVAGRNISLTLDFDVQQAADQALAGKHGAIVALAPATGEVLALSSSPAFDPNMFAGEMTADIWRDLVSGPDKRLNNRAVQGAYPPGSVFKFIMAAAGLSEGVISTAERINCPGSYRVGSRVFRCHKKSGHGPVDMMEAIYKSCDVYFYTLGSRLGIDRIHDYAARFGLGTLTGLDLVTENPGIVPSTAWKKAYFRNPEDQKWYPGETPSVSIGQGALTVTPLQTARALAALVNGGRVLRPRLVRGVESREGGWRYEDFKPDEGKPLGIEPSVLRIVQKGLEETVNNPGGTGGRARLPEEFRIHSAGKTGTAQSASADTQLALKMGDHAWFAGYAPADKAEIVVVAVVEHGGHGGAIAAPLVNQVMQAYFRKTCETEKRHCPDPVLLEEKARKTPGNRKNAGAGNAD